MKLGKVVGNVTATRKDERLVGTKLMIVQPIDHTLKDVGETIVAVDTVGAGINEIVIYVIGTASRLGARKTESPIDTAIVGIVDNIDAVND